MRRLTAVLVMSAVALGMFAALPAPAGAAAVNVGYYDTGQQQGRSEQVPPIVTAGGNPIQVLAPNAAELANLDVLFVQNPSNSGIGPEWLASFPDVAAWVAAGGVLIFHDRWVGDYLENVDATVIGDYIPGAAGITAYRDFEFDRDIDILDPNTTVTDGPGGVLDNESLDNGSSSSHGYVVRSSLPAGAVNPLARGDGVGGGGIAGVQVDSRGLTPVRAPAPAAATRLGGTLGIGTGGLIDSVRPDEVVTTCFPVGTGDVIYSTIPLDYYLNIYYDEVGGEFAFNDMAEIYAPNVVAWGMESCGTTGGPDVRVTRLNILMGNGGPGAATAQVEVENMGSSAAQGRIVVSVHLLGGGASYTAPAVPFFLPAVQRRSVNVGIRSPLPPGFGLRTTHIVLACYHVPEDPNPADNCARRFVVL